MSSGLVTQPFSVTKNRLTFTVVLLPLTTRSSVSVVFSVSKSTSTSPGSRIRISWCFTVRFTFTRAPPPSAAMPVIVQYPFRWV